MPSPLLTSCMPTRGCGGALWHLPKASDSAAPDPLGNAALFHSIYGTEGFQGYKLPLSHREEIAELCAARYHPGECLPGQIVPARNHPG